MSKSYQTPHESARSTQLVYGERVAGFEFSVWIRRMGRTVFEVTLTRPKALSRVACSVVDFAILFSAEAHNTQHTTRTPSEPMAGFRWASLVGFGCPLTHSSAIAGIQLFTRKQPLRLLAKNCNAAKVNRSSPTKEGSFPSVRQAASSRQGRSPSL